MTHDDARKLIGGYATGSLTEAERKLLFEAALEDQELFDELAREQALKELLDQPGAKGRLLTALGTSHGSRALWWTWGAVGAATAAALVAFLMLRTGEKPVEVAAVRTLSPETVPPKEVAPAPKSAPAPPAARQEPKQQRSQAPSTQTAAHEVETTLQDSKAVTKDQSGVRNATPPAAPAQAAAPGEPPPQVSRAQPLAIASGRLASKAIAPSRLAFDYSVDPARVLLVTPQVDGFLMITANTLVIFPNGRIASGSATRVTIPQAVREMTITFSPNPITDPARGLGVRRSAASGTVENPNSSPDSQIVLTLEIP